ncbi:MAG: hypothetical protein ACFHU9_01355 [Fluviicola sp.]
MISKVTTSLLTVLLIASCSTDRVETDRKIDDSPIEIESNDSSVVEQKDKPDGMELFIEEMAATKYLLDTARIKQTIWSVMGKNPAQEQDGHLIIEIPFPVEAFEHHFTNPKSYFFAHWNEEQKTFKNGNDYLLMTWTIDSIGVKNEDVIYHSLHEFMGNFPSYVFRSGKTVYAMCHRQTVMAKQTRELTETLRNYVDSSAIIHRPFEGYEPR